MTVLALAAVVLMAGVLISHAAQVSPSTDDFCNRLNATSQRLPETVQTAYTGWTGRVVTTAILHATLASADLFSLAVPGVLLAALFVYAAWLIATFSTLEWTAGRPVVFALSLATLMAGLYSLTGQALFWITGGIVYTIPLVLLLAWLVVMRRLFVDGNAGRIGAVSGFALGVLVGNAIEAVVPIALVYGASMLWLARERLSSATRRAVFACIAGVVVGAMILAAAPGNLTRVAATGGSLFENLRLLGPSSLRIASTMLDVGGVLLVAVAIMLGLGIMASRGRDRPAFGRSSETLVLMAGAIASALPILLAPDQFAPRNLYFLLVMLLVAALVFAAPRLAAIRSAPTLVATLALAGAIGNAVVYARNIDDARAIRARLVEQDALLRKAALAGERDVIVPRIGLVPPPTVHFIELAADAQRWDNRCVARYYGLKSLRTPGDG